VPSSRGRVLPAVRTTSVPAPTRHAPGSEADRAWIRDAVATIAAEFNRSADTHLPHLPRLPLPAMPGVHLYLKDESTHPTGSLEHRRARSLFLHGLVNGSIHAGTTIVEASSGSTAISEAWFARLLGLPFVAVAPDTTAARKLEEIRRLGGECVTDWRGNNTIPESLLEQLSQEPHPVPDRVVVGAGTGGTSATLGSWVRYRPRCATTRIAVADPTGTNLWAAIGLAARMHAQGHAGSVVTLICDGGERYADTYWNRDWLAREGLGVEPAIARLRALTGAG
jgi:cysteine synthase A